MYTLLFSLSMCVTWHLANPTAHSLPLPSFPASLASWQSVPLPTAHPHRLGRLACKAFSLSCGVESPRYLSGTPGLQNTA